MFRPVGRSRSCSVFFVFDLDPVPDFDLSVNLSSKSIAVTVEPGDKVHTRWCYQSGGGCIGGQHSPQTTVSIRGTFICVYAHLFVHAKKIKCFFPCVCPAQIDPSHSRSALLHVPYMLPCVCVQVRSAPDHFRVQAVVSFG